MYFLMWFMLTNLKVDFFQLGQFPTEQSCAVALDMARVLITTSGTRLICLEVVPE